MKYFARTYTPIVWHVGILRYIGTVSAYELIVVTPDIIFKERLGTEDILLKAGSRVAMVCEEMMTPYYPHQILTNDKELARAIKREGGWLDLPVKFEEDIPQLERIRKHLNSKMNNAVAQWRQCTTSADATL